MENIRETEEMDQTYKGEENSVFVPEAQIEIEVMDETYKEENSEIIPFCEPCNVNPVMEINIKKLDHSCVDTETDNQQDMEISLSLKEKENGKQTLFAPFSHNPDPELLHFVAERNVSQESATKLINDRYKWIMENAARRKAREQNDTMKLTKISLNLSCEDVVKTAQISDVDIDDVKETTQLLDDVHLAPDSLAKDQSEEFFDNQLEKGYWANSFNRLIDSLMNLSLPEHHECRVDNTLWDIRNEWIKREAITFTQADQKLGSADSKKSSNRNKEIFSSFEEIFA